MQSAGYSGIPLAKKLGIKSGHSILLYNEPSHYLVLFETLPADVTFQKDATGEVDFIHIFCTSLNELMEIAPRYKAVLKKDGLLWVSWPKGSSKIHTDLKRDAIREFMLSTGLVDVKVAAVDQDWSGLKFVYRKEDR
ncbi:Protein of unknown function [Flagellimonas flava]|uniref:DUF3052 domain-containing protein n=1 Tax=Flagellimonas flava TaxID=570519 RepID=A0A1M5ISD9_9FLAO|nr:Protein of unknown function [Allomuricauda flava]